MEEYVNISLDLRNFVDIQLDIRVPRYMTVKHCLQIVSESYNLGLEITNPNMRVVQSGQILLATTNFDSMKDGVCLYLEAI